MKKMDPVVHFEMPAEDRKRMAGFYNQVFGWQTKPLNEEMGNYELVTTSDIDTNGRPKDAGMINGGFYTRREGSSPYPTIVIAVEDMWETIKNIKAAGGRVLEEPIEIPGYGLYISFIDTENNRVSLMQPLNDSM
jgi:predicted enzyme related to lactoylglutathione lyase